MKKLLYIFLMLLPVGLFARDYQKLIANSVNKGQYATAIKYLVDVDSVESDAYFVPVYAVDGLLNYAIEHQTDYSIASKILAWAAKDFSTWGLLYTLNKDTYDEAEYYLTRAAECYKIIEGSASSHRVELLGNIIELYNEQERFAESADIYYELVDVAVENGDTISVAIILNSLSFCYYRQGELEISDSAQVISKEWFYSIADQRMANLQYITYAEQAATFYLSVRDYNRASMKYEDILKVLSTQFSPEQVHVAIATINNQKGMLALTCGKTSEAKDLLESARPILYENRESLGQPYVLNSTALARLSLYQGSFQDAYDFLYECLPIARLLGESIERKSILLSVLDELSIVEYLLHQYDSSLIHTKESLNWYDVVSMFGTPSYQHGLALLRKGLLCNELGLQDSVFHAIVQSYPILRNYTSTMFRVLSAEKREQYWETNKSRFTNVYPQYFDYFYNQGVDSIAELAYDNELFVKGLLLETDVAVRRVIIESGDSLLINLLNKMRGIDEELSLYGFDEGSSPYIESLHKQREDINRKLSIKSAIYQSYQNYQKVTWKDIQRSLSENDYAIEIANYSIAEGDTIKEKYIAIIVDKSCTYPRVVSLFSSDEIKNIIEQQPSLLYGKEGNVLGERIYNCLKLHVPIHGRVYIAPSGLLHNLAFENLLLEDGQRIGDIFSIIRVSSTRECIALSPKKFVSDMAVVYGGINYYTSQEEMMLESDKYPRDILTLRDCEESDIDRGKIKNLPGSKVEAQMICELLRNSGMEVLYYDGTQGNEESFKVLNGSDATILHIATHGFYTPLPDIMTANALFQKNIYGQVNDTTFRDPLSRCGLLFSGAANAKNNISVQDGILYAREIASMDLSNCDLAVLSACETGRGDISREGVYGLQRAFKLAGVKTIIMSLWKVDDNATRLLMTEFYTNWIKRKQSKREAFKNAQNTVRYAVDKDGDRMYENPKYWAGFIMLD